MKKQRRGLNRYNLLQDGLEIQRPSNNNHGNLKHKKNISWAPVGLAKVDSSAPNQVKFIALGWVIIESDARSTGMQLKSAAKLSTVIGLIK